MDNDYIDIYDDLDEFREEEEKKSKELVEWETKYKEALQTIEQLRKENRDLNKTIKRIEINFQSLLDTAKAEIKRKDQLIAAVRREKDDICFRRRYNHNQRDEDATTSKGISNNSIRDDITPDVSTTVNLPKEDIPILKSDIKRSENTRHTHTSRSSSDRSSEKRSRRDSTYATRHDDKMHSKSHTNRHNESNKHREKDYYSKRRDSRTNSEVKPRDRDILNRNDHRRERSREGNRNDRNDKWGIKREISPSSKRHIRPSNERNVSPSTKRDISPNTNRHVNPDNCKVTDSIEKNENLDSSPDLQHMNNCDDVKQNDDSRDDKEEVYKAKSVKRTGGDSSGSRHTQKYFERSDTIYDKRRRKSLNIPPPKVDNMKVNSSIDNKSDQNSGIHSNKLHSKAVDEKHHINIQSRLQENNIKENSNVTCSENLKADNLHNGVVKSVENNYGKINGHGTPKNFTDENFNIPALTTPKKVALFNNLFGATPSSAESSSGTVMLTNVMHVLQNTKELVSISPASTIELEEIPIEQKLKPKNVSKEETDYFQNCFIPIVQTSVEPKQLQAKECNNSVSFLTQKNEVIDIESDNNCNKPSAIEQIADLSSHQSKLLSENAIDTKAKKIVLSSPILELIVSDDDDDDDDDTCSINEPSSSTLRKERIQILEDIRLPSVFNVQKDQFDEIELERDDEIRTSTDESNLLTNKRNSEVLESDKDTNDVGNNIANKLSSDINNEIQDNMPKCGDGTQVALQKEYKLDNNENNSNIYENEPTTATTVHLSENEERALTISTDKNYDNSNSANANSKLKEQLTLLEMQENDQLYNVQKDLKDSKIKIASKISHCKTKLTPTKFHLKLSMTSKLKARKRKLTVSQEKLYTPSFESDNDDSVLKRPKLLEEINSTSQNVNGMDSPEYVHNCVRRQRRSYRILDSSSEDEVAPADVIVNADQTLIGKLLDATAKHERDAILQDPAAHLPSANVSHDEKFSEIDSRLQSMFESPPHKIESTPLLHSISSASSLHISYSTESQLNHHQDNDNTTSMLPATNADATQLTVNETVNKSMLNNEQSSINNEEISYNSSLESKHISLGSSDYRFEKVSDNVVNLFITRKHAKRKVVKKKVSTTNTLTTTTTTVT